MKKLFIPISVAILFSLNFIPTTHALILKSGEFVLLDKTSPDDVYLMAGEADINADVLGDLYVAGGEIEVDANISEDLVVAGGRVTLLGDVNGDVRILGGDVSIFGEVKDDVIVAGGKVDIGKQSKIGGTILAKAVYLSMEGSVAEDIKGDFRVLFLDGSVDGNLDIKIKDELKISDDSNIDGDLEYLAFEKAEIPDGVVKGEILFNKNDPEKIIGGVSMTFFIFELFSYAGALLLLLLFVLVVPKSLIHVGVKTREHTLKALGIGFLTMLVVFVAPIILLMTVIGIPLAFIMFAMLIVIFCLAQIFVAAWLGSYFMSKDTRKKKDLLKWKIFGLIALTLLAYHLVGFIPYVGWIVKIVLFLTGVGAMYLLKKDAFEALNSKKLV